MSNERIKLNSDKEKKDKQFFVFIIAIFLVVLIVLTIGLPVWRKEAKKKLISAPIEDDLEQLFYRKKQLLENIENDNIELKKLLKYRKKALLLSRIVLVSIVISINLIYHCTFSASKNDLKDWIDDFRNCSTSMILIYTTLGFIIYGNVKLFSKKIRQRIFRNAFKKEFNLTDSISQMNSRIKEIDLKITLLKN